MSSRILQALTTFWFPSVSARYLALIRIMLGSAMLYDTLSSISQRHLMFGAEGILGELGSRRSFGNMGSFLESHGYFLPGLGYTGLDLLFAIYICAIIFFLVGYVYRLSAVIVTVIFFYLQMRNYLVFDSGHSLAAILIFFFIFLPADTTASLSHYLKYKKWRYLWSEKTLPSAWALRTIQVQMCILYLSTFLFKMEGPNWRNGTAVYYATRLPVYMRPSLQFFFDLSSVTFVATYGTLLIEGVFAFLIWNRRLRPWVIASAIGFHLVLERVFYINIFQWIMIAGILSFLADRPKGVPLP